MSRKTRPTKAGLNGFRPKPPNDIFPMPIATNAPKTISQGEIVAGRLNASRVPVTTADQSPSVQFACRNKNRLMNHSNSIQDKIAIPVVHTAVHP